MKLLDRIRSWFDRAPAADPADLHRRPSEGPGATTGLDRPLAETGPLADPPIGDPPDTEPPERPLG